jgi:hypothetical protein
MEEYASERFESLPENDAALKIVTMTVELKDGKDFFPNLVSVIGL